MAPPSSTERWASAPVRPWPHPGWRSRQGPRFFVATLSTWNAPSEVVDDPSFRADDQAEQQVVDVLQSVAAFPEVGWLKRNLLHEWQRDAGPDAILVPPTTAPVVIGLVRGKRFPAAAENRERVCDE